MDDKLSPE